MAHTTFDSSDLGAFTPLASLGLEVTDQLVEKSQTASACRITGDDRLRRRCGAARV